LQYLRILISLSGLACLGTPSASNAAATTARDIPGYRCMALNLDAHQMMDPSVEIPVLSQPSSTASPIGFASSTVAAKDPPTATNGFIEVLFPSGQKGWVLQSDLKAWRAAVGTSAHCKPVWLSNGRVSFHYPN